MFPINPSASSYNPYYTSSSFHAPCRAYPSLPFSHKPFPTYLIEPMVGKWQHNAPNLNLSPSQESRLSSVFARKFENEESKIRGMLSVSLRAVKDMDGSGNVSVGDIALLSKSRMIDSTIPAPKSYVITPDVVRNYYSPKEF